MSIVDAISIGRHTYHLVYDRRPDGDAELAFDAEKWVSFLLSIWKEKRLLAGWLTKEELMGGLFQKIPF